MYSVLLSNVLKFCVLCTAISIAVIPAWLMAVDDVEPISHWQRELARPDLTAQARFDRLLQLAAAYHSVGHLRMAQDTLQQAETVLNPLRDTDDLRRRLLYHSRSDLALSLRLDRQAREAAEHSLSQLPENFPPLLHATLLNNLGNVQSVEAHYVAAEASYRQALGLAEQSGDDILAVRILINLARISSRQQDWTMLFTRLQQVQHRLPKSPVELTQAQVSALLSMVELLLTWYEQVPQPFDEKRKTFVLQLLQQAQSAADRLASPRLQSYVQGYLGYVYERHGEYDTALRATRQAIFFAQQINALEVSYRWHWQVARLFRQQQQREAALAAYRKAVEQLEPMRQALTLGYRDGFQSFRDTTGRLYFELADLLLQPDPNTDKFRLLEARDTIERLKTAELQDYFQDDCLTASAHLTPLGEASPAQTAILYPIILADRLEWLLSLPDGLHQVTLPLSAQTLKDELNEFRFELETRNTLAFLPYAQRLYRWLIQPLESLLREQQIQTILLIPDGVLRTIPLAALHTGQEFLIQRYAIIVALSLSVMPPFSSGESSTPTLLLSGLSVATQGYSALPYVLSEIQAVQHLYPQTSTVLLNEQFTEKHFSEALRHQNFDIVHIASHGQFSNDPDQTWLLTHEGNLTMDRLERLIRLSDLRNEPMELLTLSACQTAVGDDQAALGLAGIALKAGARNALATLWFIDDEASSVLVSEFYRRLQQNIPKAQALQQAQQFLLQQSRYQHPAFWASFLLIGNEL
ncbi:CHAT domain-containing protein [Thioflexithrix psekupsensis]|uniref:CHAT domain-containing protein n=1 Tax=Thioflexithrix psekupsensis TaxID=1570016 RepID=A0A251XCH3_9GAMM|nr:CHAT domain-containing protein [Thioflexithrix psekupsensis]OUD15746.1 hypothetical protein TPSD3_04350 [Thioflexithrix psekupsensis]